MDISPIAVIHNDYGSKFAVPRQSGIAETESRIVFEKPFADENAVRRLEGFSHLWLIWGFSENEGKGYSLTVRPPRLGGNERVGVFASRSPFRPNGLGLSCVRLERIDYDTNRTPTLCVTGADLTDGTPIYDIKPYIRFTDSRPDAVSGYVDEVPFRLLKVNADDGLLAKLPEEKRAPLLQILQNDPRPAYRGDSERIYGFPYAGFEIKFKVEDGTLTVTDII